MSIHQEHKEDISTVNYCQIQSDDLLCFAKGSDSVGCLWFVAILGLGLHILLRLRLFSWHLSSSVIFLSSPKSTLLFISDRMRFLNCMGNFVQVQPGCDGLEHCLSGGQLSALVLSPVQAQAGEFFIYSFIHSYLLYRKVLKETEFKMGLTQ